MLGDYKVNRCTRRCFAQERPLREGEWYYSVVLESGDDHERRDYSADAWDSPPEGTIGWWKNRMPTSDQKKLVLAPNEVLVDLLRQMGEFPEKAQSRYLLALMLLRRKVVRPIDDPGAVAAIGTTESSSDHAERTDFEADDEQAADSAAVVLADAVVGGATAGPCLSLEVIADGSHIDVPVAEISRSESDSLRDELNELLYCEAEEE